MHKFAKQIADCLKAKVEGKGIDNINGADIEELKIWSEIIKNIVCYDKDYKIIEAMDEEKEEDEKDEKYFIKMLKEEYGMDDEEEARRYYRGQPRSRTSGRFMSRGDGRRSNRGGRRGYEEYPAYLPESYNPMEWERDMDRGDGRMYYSGKGTNPRPGGIEKANSTSSGRDYREGKSGQSRRYYMESKEIHSDNSPESKQVKMRELEKYMSELSSDVTEMISGASPEEKSLLKTKLQTLAAKV